MATGYVNVAVFNRPGPVLADRHGLKIVCSGYAVMTKFAELACVTYQNRWRPVTPPSLAQLTFSDKVEHQCNLTCGCLSEVAPPLLVSF